MSSNIFQRENSFPFSSQNPLHARLQPLARNRWIYIHSDPSYFSSSRPIPLNEVFSIVVYADTFIERLAARGYYVIANDFAVHHQLSPSPSQNRACATNAQNVVDHI
jgi:hypothetical protein